MRAVREVPRRGALGRMAGNLLLNLAAVGGAICLVLVFLAFFFNASLILFKTGSMSPTIPAGSVALIRQVPAAKVEVGDILTVDRPGKLPVTHRVVATSPGDAPGQRMIRLKGDANKAEDTAPYAVAEAGLVLWHIPGLANTIVWFSNPWVLGLITVTAGTLVTWTFWPRASTDTSSGPRRRKASVRDSSTPAPIMPTTPKESPDPVPKTRGPGRHVGRSLMVLIGVALTMSPMASSVPSAHSDTTDRQINGQFLRLTSVTDHEAMTTLAPGDSVDWQLGVRAHAPSPGQLEVGYAFDGGRSLPMQITTAACTARWQHRQCPAAEVPVKGIAMDGTKTSGHLLSFEADEQRWIQVRVRIPEAPAIAHGSVTNLRLTVDGAGEEVSTDPIDPTPENGSNHPNSSPETPRAAPDSTIHDSLPPTGGQILGALLWGLIAVMGGLAISLLARLLQRRSGRA